MQVKPAVDWVELNFDEGGATFSLELPAISVSCYELTDIEQAAISRLSVS